MNKSKNIFVGLLIGLVCAFTIIFAIEEKKSLLQIFAGFIIFIFPITFFSSFFSKTGMFIFTFISVLIIYLTTKYYFHDFWIGVILAVFIGGAAFYYRVNPYKPFSPSDYKEKAKEFYLKNKK